MAGEGIDGPDPVRTQNGLVILIAWNAPETDARGDHPLGFEVPNVECHVVRNDFVTTHGPVSENDSFLAFIDGVGAHDVQPSRICDAARGTIVDEGLAAHWLLAPFAIGQNFKSLAHE